MKKIMRILLAAFVCISGLAIARGGGGGGGGGGFHGGGGGFGGGHFGGESFGGRSFGGYHGGYAGYHGGYARTAGYSNVGRGGYARGAGYSRAGYSRTGQRTTVMAPGKSAGTGHMGQHAGMGQRGPAGKGAAGRGATSHTQHQTKMANANKTSGLNKQNVNNRQSLQQHQQAAKNKIGKNSKLAGMNRNNARNMVNGRGWGYWHNGFWGWNPLWWGLGFGLLWPLGAWGWGWNWAWLNGVWWWAGYPWWWWQDYDPDYFETVVYPQYVADYQDVSGDQVKNYWDITNDTDEAITVKAAQGDTATIEAGKTKRVFHSPSNNKFTAQTAEGVKSYNVNTPEVTIAPNAPAA